MQAETGIEAQRGIPVQEAGRIWAEKPRYGMVDGWK